MECKNLFRFVEALEMQHSKLVEISSNKSHFVYKLGISNLKQYDNKKKKSNERIIFIHPFAKRDRLMENIKN